MPKKLTHEQFVKKLKLARPDISVIGTYLGWDVKIEFSEPCLVAPFHHQIHFYATPGNVLSGHGSSKNKVHKAKMNDKNTRFWKPDEFRKHINDLYNGEVEVLTDYVHNKTKVRCREPDLQNNGYYVEWEVSPKI